MQTGTKGPLTRVGSPAIVARRLTKRFGSVTAVDDLSFEAVPGKVTGFVGPNGAGKSTTLRMLLGLVEPDDGNATILGLPYASLAGPITVAGAVLEVQSFHPLRSGRNHLRVLAAASGVDDRRVDEVLEVVEMTAAGRRKAGSYSLGMRQRLGVAGALLGGPAGVVLGGAAKGGGPPGIRWAWEAGGGPATGGKARLGSGPPLGRGG